MRLTTRARSAVGDTWPDTRRPAAPSQDSPFAPRPRGPSAVLAGATVVGSVLPVTGRRPCTACPRSNRPAESDGAAMPTLSARVTVARSTGPRFRRGAEPDRRNITLAWRVGQPNSRLTARSACGNRGDEPLDRSAVTCDRRDASTTGAAGRTILAVRRGPISDRHGWSCTGRTPGARIRPTRCRAWSRVSRSTPHIDTGVTPGSAQIPGERLDEVAATVARSTPSLRTEPTHHRRQYRRPDCVTTST